MLLNGDPAPQKLNLGLTMELSSGQTEGLDGFLMAVWMEQKKKKKEHKGTKFWL